jgi:hypothetical protein
MRIRNRLHNAIRRRDIPKNSANNAVALPGSNEFDEKRLVEPIMKYLRYAVEVGDEHGLQDDTHIRGEEELDGDALDISWMFLADDLHLRREPLHVDQHQEDEERPC